MSSPIARLYTDTAGGPIIAPGGSNVFVNGQQISVEGDIIQGHGEYEHSAPSILTGSSTVRVGGRGVTRMVDTTTCGHDIISSSNVYAG